MSQEFVLIPEPIPLLDRGPRTVFYDSIIKAFIEKHVPRARVEVKEFSSSTLYTGLRYRLKRLEATRRITIVIAGAESLRAYKQGNSVYLVNSDLFKINLKE